jgi:hypothetical protein
MGDGLIGLAQAVRLFIASASIEMIGFLQKEYVT